MKAIFIMSDSFRRDHVGVYGNKWIHTPNLDKFGREGNVFTKAVTGFFPTVPNRMDLLLGRFGGTDQTNFRFTPDDITVGDMLAKKGIPSQLVSDTANVIRDRQHYKGFTAWTHLRGQEGDSHRIDYSVPYEQTCPLSMIRYPKEHWHRVLMNRAHRKVETDWFAPGTFNWAMQWLQNNYRQKDFLLWIDTFDPHEPFDPPQYYTDLYDPGYKGRLMEAPTYGIRKKLDFTDRELQQTRARYAGECTMVDHWFGKLLETLDKLRITDDTMVIFTTDHGHYHDFPSDGGLTGKAGDTEPSGAWWRPDSKGKPTHHPIYLSMLRQPLLIRVPKAKSQRIPAYAQPCDIAPTILDYFGIKTPGHCHGQSLLPLIAGKKKAIRNAAVSRYPGRMAILTNDRWSYCCWAGVRPCALWDLRKDPNQKRNIARKNPDVVKRLHAILAEALRRQNTDEDFIKKLDPMV